MALEVLNLEMNFLDAGKKVELFRNLSFRVEEGESVAIVGRSGVGKTTLLYLLAGLEFPRSGDVKLAGVSYQRLRSSNSDMAAFRRDNIGFVFQFHNLLAEFDAVENVALPLLIKGSEEQEARKKAVELLHRVGLGHRLSHRPGTLSGGEQQRVALARAVISKPRLILADEPTGNLDQNTAREVKELLLELQRQNNVTLLLVTHSLELAANMDRVLELTSEGLAGTV